MKVRKTTTQADENLILSACVTSKRALSEITSLPGAEFATPHANIVYRWCQNHFDLYGEAPGTEIIGTEFAGWSDIRLQNNPADATVEAVEKFLSQLTDTPVNSDLISDKISVYFSRNSLKQMLEEARDAVALGDVRNAADLVSSWRPTEIGGDSSVDVLGDEAAIRSCFEDSTEQLVHFPGALGEFFHRDLSRDSFVSFLAAEKVGKTSWLRQIAWRGLLEKRNVAFLGLGDMTKPQYMRDFMRMATKLPDYPKEVLIPTYCGWHPTKDRLTVTTVRHRMLRGITPEAAIEASRKVMETSGLHARIKLEAFANSTMGVSNIESLLDRWERSGWIPDIVVLDYADLLMPPRGYKDDRDGINQNWKMLRRISQERHCLIVTATQAAARGYDKWLLDMGCFSEDKRKLSHVTAMIGINRTRDENENDVSRLNIIARRNGLAPSKPCVVAGCRDIGHVAIRSCF